MTVNDVWISNLNNKDFYAWFYFSIFSLVLVLIEKIYQTLETVFHRLSKHLEFRQKYSAARRIFNSLLGVWKCGETRSFVFDTSNLFLGLISSLKFRHLASYEMKNNCWLFERLFKIRENGAILFEMSCFVLKI